MTPNPRPRQLKILSQPHSPPNGPSVGLTGSQSPQPALSSAWRGERLVSSLRSGQVGNPIQAKSKWLERPSSALNGAYQSPTTYDEMGKRCPPMSGLSTPPYRTTESSGASQATSTSYSRTSKGSKIEVHRSCCSRMTQERDCGCEERFERSAGAMGSTSSTTGPPISPWCLYGSNGRTEEAASSCGSRSSQARKHSSP
jgi:hypothetical protein